MEHAGLHGAACARGALLPVRATRLRRRGVQQLAAGLGAGALPALRRLVLEDACMWTTQAVPYAPSPPPWKKAPCRGSATSSVRYAAIGDAGLVALAPALRRRPALEYLDLDGNLLGDEGLAALVAPPAAAGAPPPPTGGLAKLKVLFLGYTQITDAGCATLAAALESGALPALERLILHGIPASAAAKAAVYAARANLHGCLFAPTRASMAWGRSRSKRSRAPRRRRARRRRLGRSTRRERRTLSMRECDRSVTL